MAYAILGNVPPIIGIYMAFFPVLVYLFLGTSRHNSMGKHKYIQMIQSNVKDDCKYLLYNAQALKLHFFS